MSDVQVVQTAIDTLLRERPPSSSSPTSFLGAQFDLGLAWVHFPVDQGGLGVAAELQSMVEEQLLAAHAPRHPEECFIGVGMQAPTIAAHGSDEQRGHVRGIFSTEEVWCQLFSEPSAGSDVAGLATSAVKVEGGWKVNGQKVWTSWAHRAHWGQLLARTDPDQPKHRGLSCFLVDMTSPGVEVRPLFQMSGEAEFNEVYFTDVFVPDEGLLGDVGAGWHVAITTLMNERVSLGAMVAPTGLQAMAGTVALWEREATDDPTVRDDMVKLWMRAELAAITLRRVKESGAAGNPGPGGSIGKLVNAELRKDIGAFNLRLRGMDGLLYEPGFARTREATDRGKAHETGYDYLRSRAATIEGGTSEIMRNILGERVLGLSEEPRLDKGIPWREVRRG